MIRSDIRNGDSEKKKDTARMSQESVHIFVLVDLKKKKKVFYFLSKSIKGCKTRLSRAVHLFILPKIETRRREASNPTSLQVLAFAQCYLPR